MDCSPPGSLSMGVVQARILEWVAISFSRDSFQPRDQTQVSSIAGAFFTDWATREAQVSIKYLLNERPKGTLDTTLAKLEVAFVVQSLSRVRLCDPMDCSTPDAYYQQFFKKKKKKALLLLKRSLSQWPRQWCQRLGGPGKKPGGPPGQEGARPCSLILLPRKARPRRGNPTLNHPGLRPLAPHSPLTSSGGSLARFAEICKGIAGRPLPSGRSTQAHD